MGVLCAIWPEQMGAAEAELDSLGECLGDAHDLALLIEPKVLKRFRKCSEEEAEALRVLVEKRQKELQHLALMMGARFYQEKPSIFCNRLRQYWKRWRRDRKKLESGVEAGARASQLCDENKAPCQRLRLKRSAAIL